MVHASNAPPPTNAAGATIRNHDMLALRSYIQAQDGSQNASRGNQTDSLWLDLTHSNLQQRHAEIRFFAGDTLQDLRARIHRQTGTSASCQHLQLYWGNELLAEFPPGCAQEARTLASLQLQSGQRVHCIDTNPLSISAGGALEDTTLIKKFELTDEQYQSKSNTLAAWARSQKELDPAFSLEKHAAQHAAFVEAKRLFRLGQPVPAGFEVQDGVVVPIAGYEAPQEDFGAASVAHCVNLQERRCQVTPGQRRGVVAWVGEFNKGNKAAAAKSGHWVGIIFDEPTGLSDGSKDGVSYFTCPAKYGGFCRGKNVQVGDFPERDLFGSDDDSDEEL